MGNKPAENIILIGFSYTGKTRVGNEVARMLGWKFVDSDEEIVRLAGKPISQIFAEDGEGPFRDMERRVLKKLCRAKKQVISTGGGAIMDEDNRDLMVKSGVVVCLEAKPSTIYQRLLKDANENRTSVVRPLLAGEDPPKRIEWLKSVRQPFYAICHWTVHTDNLTPEEAASEIVRGFEYARRDDAGVGAPPTPSRRESDAPYCQEQGSSAVVRTYSACYPIFVGWGIIDQLGMRMKNAGLAGRVHIISDDRVYPLYGEKVKQTLEKAGFAVDSFAVPHGENSKSLEVATCLYDWLVEARAERGDCIVALGGGVVGDLAGFIAATFLRGLRFVQVPTSLVAMVDASIGGKVAIDHPRGKNLIGAFYQPRLVLADTQALTTLPKREFSGWAEVIKHGLIRDPGLVDLLETKRKALLRLYPKITTEVVARSAAIKAGVVSEDEKETGVRTILNYGHTIGHGLEAATNYERFLHGEAVAVGMMGAAKISERMGLLSEAVVKRQKALLESFGLPTTCSGVDINSVLKAMELDKKVRGKKVRWVLLSDVGQTVIRDDVPEYVVREVVGAL